MARRTKIVATIGPASDEPARLEALLRAGADVIRINLSHGVLDEHLDRLGARPRAWRPRSGGRSACSPTSRGRRSAPGRSRTAGSGSIAGRRRAPRARQRAEHARRRHRRLPDAARRPRSRRSRRDRRRRHHDARARASTTTAVVRRGGERAATRRAAPACTCRASASRCSRPTAQDLELAEAVAAAGVEYVALSFVRRAADVRALRAGRRRPRRHRRQDRDRRRRSGSWPRSPGVADARDGGARRPRHRLPARGRARTCRSTSSATA